MTDQRDDEGGMSDKVSCCPTPMSICGVEGQCCCAFYKCSFPCNSAVPLELGCCGAYCVDKKDDIQAYEMAAAAEKNDDVVEAVIVSKGGAPPCVVADEMERGGDGLSSLLKSN